MKVAYYPQKIDNQACTLILGAFSSIHNGHYELIKTAKKLKKSIHVMVVENVNSLPSTTKNTFEGLQLRLQKFANLKVDKVTVVKFDQNIRLMPGKEFIASLVKITNAKHLVIGEDFGCGRNRAYQGKDIARDYPTTIVPHLKINNIKIATSLLREMILAGEVDVVKQISPIPFGLNAKVKEGKIFSFIDTLRPHSGIYIVSAIVNDILYWGYAHLAFDQTNYLFLNNFLFDNKPYEATIYFHKLSRIIISKSQDQVFPEDQKRINQYFTLT